MPNTCTLPLLLNDWEESASHPDMDQTGPLPHNTARTDSLSGCRLHDLQPRLVAKMAQKWLSQQQCMPHENTTRLGHAHNIKRVSIQGPKINHSLITMYSSHWRGWNSQSYGSKMKNSAHCSRTFESIGTNTLAAALLVTSYWRSNYKLCTHATMVDQLYSARK
jgi:hypothetical protein